MLLVEVVANAMLLVSALIALFLVLNKVMQRVVDHGFARIARVEAQGLDEKLRRLNG